MPMKIQDLLTDEELAEVTSKNNWLGFNKVLFDWTIIISTFILVGAYPSVVTILLGIMVLGARQLGLGVVVHETGHRTLLSSAFWNNLTGTWLSGYWIFSDKETYMRGHLEHHKFAGTEQDPDLGNYRSYPINRTSLRRKFTRDLTGQVGWRRLKSIARAIGRIPTLKPHMRQYLLRCLGVNALMLGTLTLFGAPWLYLLWVVAFTTSHMLVVRIRQISEHAAVPDAFDADARKNTRTLYISWLERFLIAPHQVNYHLEHHMLASVPIYRLQHLHEILLKKGYYDDIEFQKGYFNLLRRVTFA